jgi:hypothetical protein
MKGRNLGEKAFTRRTPMEGAPGGPRKGMYGALGSCLGSGGWVEGDEGNDALDVARGEGTAFVRRAGTLGRSGIAVEDDARRA